MAEEIITFRTKEDFEKFHEELNYLRTTKRAEIAEKLREARAMGDLSENPVYDSLREELSRLYDEIEKREEILKMLITEPATDILQ